MVQLPFVSSTNWGFDRLCLFIFFFFFLSVHFFSFLFENYKDEIGMYNKTVYHRLSPSRHNVITVSHVSRPLIANRRFQSLLNSHTNITEHNRSLHPSRVRLFRLKSLSNLTRYSAWIVIVLSNPIHSGPCNDTRYCNIALCVCVCVCVFAVNAKS